MESDFTMSEIFVRAFVSVSVEIAIFLLLLLAVVVVVLGILPSSVSVHYIHAIPKETGREHESP